jgi:hypothetical protein
LASPVAFVHAGGFFENFLYGLHVAQSGTLPVYYNPTSRKSTMVATNDIGAEVATLLTGPAWSGHRVIELGSMVSADEVAAQLRDVMHREVKAFAVPRAEWPAAFEQFGIPKGQTGPAEAMFEAVNAGWMDLGVAGRNTSPAQRFPAMSSRRPRRPPRRQYKYADLCVATKGPEIPPIPTSTPWGDRRSLAGLSTISALGGQSHTVIPDSNGHRGRSMWLRCTAYALGEARHCPRHV